MSGLISYSGIITKIRAMKVRLLDPKDYEKIINLDGVSEFIAFLKQHPNYFKLFEHVDEQRIHRGQIEHIIVNSLYQDYSKIYKFSNRRQRMILSLYFFRFEIKVIKDCILSVFHKEDEFREFLFMDFFKSHSRLPMDRLIGLEKMEDLIQNLKGTKYYNTLRVVSNQSDATLFDYETQLDVYYYKELWKLKDELLRGKELKAFTDVIGHQIDLLNILWIYRFKLSYSIETIKIFASIIPIHYKLTKKQLSDMVETVNLEEFFGMLKKSHYGRYFNTDDSMDLEVLFRKIIRDVYKRNAKKYPNSISPIHEFLYLKEIEIDKLTTALECIRYQMNPEESLAILRD